MIYSSFNLFLIHLWIGFVSCAVYHIVPSPDHYCPAKSCLTLSSFAANASLYLDNNTSLIFQPGNHTINSKLYIIDIVNFSMMSNQTRAGIICENDLNPGFIFDAVNRIHVSNLKFFECYCDYYCLGNQLIILTASSLIFFKCIFEDNVGIGMINAAQSNVTIAQSTFKDNYLESHLEILTFTYSNITIINCTFIDNVGKSLFIKYNLFNNHKMVSTLIITGCEFRNNHALPSPEDNRIIDVYNSDILSIYNTKFIGNKAAEIVFATSLIVTMKSVVNTDNCTFKYNHGSAMYLIDCKVYIFNSVFNNNDAGLILSSSIIYIYGSEFKENVGNHGAIECSNSLISFSETCIIADNHAEWQGGALYLAYESQCFVVHGATVIIANNTASDDGGGIYLNDHSNLTLHSQSMLQILENRATKNGGGIYISELSSINLGIISLNYFIGQTSNSTINFYRNQARLGGGLYVGLNSTVYIFLYLNNTINFDKNLADYGGAVYVLTESTSQYYPECFFQSLQNPAQKNIKAKKFREQDKFPIQFSLNRANSSGFSLFKRIFGLCSINGSTFEEFEALKALSNVQNSDVGSFQVQVCFCENGAPECTKEIQSIDIKTGAKLIIDGAIADRGNHAVNGSIVSEIRGSVLTRDDQKIQDTISSCSPLIFNIYSFEASLQLIMSPQLERDSMYITTERSKRSIKLNFLACIDCPTGFQKAEDAKGCSCVCNEVLVSYIINCNYTAETIIKKGTTAWITYLKVKNSSNFLIHPYCPLDYCLPPDVIVEINLNIPNGADAQCAHNRSGLLCGACSPGLSLSLGSSRCLPFHTHWPGVFLVMIISSLFAGIVLVGALLVLNLTVATGTLNALIFYANIVAANQDKFFPSTSVITVFVSLFNLELGIDTYLFDGMDFYWKTWVEIAFPVYILLLVLLIIVISECSVKFTELMAKKNPLATLNTLILLSYVKFLRIIILAFSFATLDYPDGSHPVVWWPDATVGYFSGKHIVLWAVAAVILGAGIFYTTILFSWQWLLYYQHKMIFKWIAKNQRLCMFIEPNHAPYAFKHRYWAGLLLLVRVIVYTISTVDVSSDRTITFLAIGIITFFLTVFVCSFRPYKSWLVQVLEVICYANIMCFCLATFYVSKVGNSQDVIAYISGTLSLVLFLTILSYHVITELFFATPPGNKLKNKLAKKFSDTETEEQINLVAQDKKNDEPVTYSVVDPPIRGEEEPQPHPDIPRSRKNTTNNVSESADYEENELKPIELKMANSSIPYTLMK